jgi:hypothetical protein
LHEATNALNRAMPPELHRRIRMAIEIASVSHEFLLLSILLLATTIG